MCQCFSHRDLRLARHLPASRIPPRIRTQNRLGILHRFFRTRPLPHLVAGLRHGRQGGQVDVGQAGIDLLRPHALDAPSQAVHPAGRVHQAEPPPVALRQHVAGLMQRRHEGLAAVGRLPEAGDFGGDRVHRSAGAGSLLDAGGRRRPCRPELAVPLDMRTLHPSMAKLALQLPRHLFVCPIVPAIGHRPHGGTIDARPHDMEMLPPRLAMLHHSTRMAGQAKPALQSSNGVRLLLPVEDFIGAVLIEA